MVGGDAVDFAGEGEGVWVDAGVSWNVEVWVGSADAVICRARRHKGAKFFVVIILVVGSFRKCALG